MNRLLKAAAALCALAIPMSAQVQIGKNVQLGAATAGGAGNPASPFFSCQFNNSGTFGGSSGCQMDASGNVRALSLQGFPDAFLNQTTPTSNDGIKNILSSTLLYANVGPTYAGVEAVPGSIPYIWRVPIVNAVSDFYFTGTPPYAEVTGFQDNRLSGQFGWSSLGQFFYDPQSTPFGTAFQPTVYNRIYHDDQPQSAGAGSTLIGWQTDCSWQGSGKMQTGIPDVHKCMQLENASLVRGIDSPFTLQGYRAGWGDYQNFGNDLWFQGNAPYFGDEGATNYRNQSIEQSLVYTSHAASTHARGATTIVVNKVGNGIGGDGDPAIDQTQSSAQFIITDHTASPNDFTPGTLTTDATWTPDVKGLVTTDLSSAVPQQYNGATTQVSINVTGLTAPLTASPAGVGDACFAKDAYIESAHIVSVGTFSGGNQTAVVNLRYNYRANSVVEQGPNACHFVEFLANQINNNFGVQAPLRNYTRIIGCPSAHVCDYASPIAGHWAPQPGGAVQNILLPLGTITRDGAGHVSAPLIGITNNPIFGGMRIRISGASDSSFNGDFVISQSGFATITLSWAQSGSAATAAAGLIVPILVNTSNISGGVIANAAVMYPGAEVVNQANPTTHAVDGTFLVEANNMTIANGDQIEIQHGNEPISNLEHNLVQQWTPIGSSEAMNEEFLDGFLTDGYARFRINVTVPFGGSAEYLGAGGTRNPTLQLFNIQGANIWATYFTMPAPANTITLIDSCPLTGCTQQAEPWGILEIINGHAAFKESWSEWNQVWLVQNQNTLFSTNGSGVFFQGNDGAGHNFLNQMTDSFLDFGIAGPSGTFTEILQGASQIETTAINLTTTSHFIQIPSLFTMDQPLNVQGSPVCTIASGCPGSGTGFTLTTTGSSGAATLISGVLNIPIYTGGGGGAVSSVSNSDGTLTITPTTGAVVASLALGHANTWTGLQTLVATNVTGLPLTTGITGILGPNHGGTGINNSATLTLGSSNQNWATIGTGIVKVTTTTGAITDAVSADVIALWSGTCSSSTFLRGDGACAAASGSTGISGLTAGFVPLGGSSITITANSHIDDGVTTASTLTATEPLAINDSSGVGGGIDGTEGTAHTGATSVDNLWADSTAHRLKMINNNGTATNIVGFSDLASSSLFGVVKVDGTTITASGGVISSVSGGTTTIASGTSALGTSSIASGACATVVTTTATGAASTDGIIWNPNGSIKAVTGYTPSTSGGLTIAMYPTTNNVNVDVCNWTASSITPGAVTLNWRIVR